MAPPRKKARTTPPEEAPLLRSSLLLSDNRAQWLVKCVPPHIFAAVVAVGHQDRQPLLTDPRPSRSDLQTVEIRVKNGTRNESLLVHRHVLTNTSEYFDRCLKEPWSESKGLITFDDIEPQFLALYIGVAYAHSSMVSMTAPPCSADPQATGVRTRLKDLVEVYKLCDRFISPVLTDYIAKCINVAMLDGHRALYRSQADQKLQLCHITDFADGYEALELRHLKQKAIGDVMIKVFCEGVSYAA